MVNSLPFLFVWPLVNLNFEIKYGKLGTLVLSYKENKYRVTFDKQSRVFDCTWNRNDFSSAQVTFEFQRLLRRIENKSRHAFRGKVSIFVRNTKGTLILSKFNQNTVR